MNTGRRHFIALASGGLTLALLPMANGSPTVGAGETSTAAATPELNQPFVRIAPDGAITVIVKHLEMGQGISTGLATILADALDADWTRVRTEAAPFNPTLYKHLLFGSQTTGGSTSISQSWQQLRDAGSVARAMLLQAAAQRWELSADELRTRCGEVIHEASGKRASYGELATAAALLPVPKNPRYRAAAADTLIGHDRNRLDVAAMTTGDTCYGIDIKRPGQRVAMIQRPLRFGGKVLRVNADAALSMPGVRGVHTVSQGVAVVADNTWIAMQARRLLKIEWDDSAAERRSTPELQAEFRRLADTGVPGVDGLVRGDVSSAMAGAATVLSADFELPYLAHQAMEPLAAVAEWKDGLCHVWAGSQNPSADHAAAVRLLGLAPDCVHLHVLPAGGSFGRRASLQADWISALMEVLIAHRHQGGDAPIQLLWSREDDVTGGYFRPMNLHRIRAGLDATGRIVATEHTIVAQSFLFGAPKPGVDVRHDPTVTEGHLAGRYDVPHARMRWVNASVGVPVQMYRALGYNHTSFSKEVLMDELARAAGQDALAFRLVHLMGHPRQAAVLRRAAQLAGWGQIQPSGCALGLAVQEAYKTFVAQVAQVRIVLGRVVVERVICVVDCGIAINPNTVRAQMEGGIVFGLTAALHSQITLEAGLVLQSNFHDAPVLRLNELPAIEVEILASTEAPTGVGEPGSVPIMAAVANAVAALTGRPVRSLPLRLSG